MEGAEEAPAEGSEFAGEEDDEGDKGEYVRKEFFAKPYVSDGITEEAVNQLIVKKSR